jgi:Carboxylesterase family
MSKEPARRIVNFVGGYNEDNDGSMPSLSLGPAADGRVVFQNYIERYARVLYSKVPAIVSNAADEGAGLTMYPANNRSAGPWQVAAGLTTTSRFICPAHNTSELRVKSDSVTYRYQYAGNFSNISPRGWMDAYHDSDLPMVMGTYNDFRPREGERLVLQRRTSERMQDQVLALMRDPASAPRMMGWGGFAGSQILRFAASDGRVAQNASVMVVEGVCYRAGTYDSSP